MELDFGPRERGREADVEAIMEFVSAHPHSYASLAVCRRALDSGIGEIDRETLEQLRAYLKQAPDEEIAAYYSIIS